MPFCNSSLFLKTLVMNLCDINLIFCSYEKQFSFVIFLVFLGAEISAQVTTSNIRGKVMDDQGLALMGADVIAIHTPTGTKYGVITNSDGRFNMLNLRVGGPYTVTISYLGFKTQTQKEVFFIIR